MPRVHAIKTVETLCISVGSIPKNLNMSIFWLKSTVFENFRIELCKVAHFYTILVSFFELALNLPNRANQSTLKLPQLIKTERKVPGTYSSYLSLRMVPNMILSEVSAF